ncbi:MAG: methionyl-tRNA formyltransferase [Thermodesulfobacteriota bacterium]
MRERDYRIIFMGTPDFAVPSLKALIDAGHDILAVVTRPDRPKGRGRVLAMPPVKEEALRYGIKVLQPEKINDKGFVKDLKAFVPEIVVVVAYGKILPGSIIDMPPKGCINLHASLLPKYRGAAPINWAIINGEVESGITTMFMDRGMDTGPILMAEDVPIGIDDTSAVLHDILKEKGARLLVRTLDLLSRDAITPIPQDDSKATYAPMLKKEDGRIDWKKGADEVRNLTRGLYPWPGAFTNWNEKVLKILEGSVRPVHVNDRPGMICAVDENGIEVATNNGIFIIKELQPANKSRMTAAEFIKGYSIGTGQILN